MRAAAATGTRPWRHRTTRPSRSRIGRAGRHGQSHSAQGGAVRRNLPPDARSGDAAADGGADGQRAAAASEPAPGRARADRARLQQVRRARARRDPGGQSQCRDRRRPRAQPAPARGSRTERLRRRAAGRPQPIGPAAGVPRPCSRVRTPELTATECGRRVTGEHAGRRCAAGNASRSSHRRHVAVRTPDSSCWTWATGSRWPIGRRRAVARRARSDSPTRQTGCRRQYTPSRPGRRHASLPAPAEIRPAPRFTRAAAVGSSCGDRSSLRIGWPSC